MAGRLQGKIAMVTGCGSVGPGWGNGKAISVLFAREGAVVFGIDASTDAAAETQGIIEGENGVCRTFIADVADEAQVSAAVGACLDDLGRIDILVNNVGIARVGGAGVGRGAAGQHEERLPDMPSRPAGDGAAGWRRDRQQCLDRRVGVVRRELRRVRNQQGSNGVDDTQHCYSIRAQGHSRQLCLSGPDEHAAGA
jgi:NAD(P)-dependent dehydrogenase (short-subunit alcohol dehydrogenase family)